MSARRLAARWASSMCSPWVRLTCAAFQVKCGTARLRPAERRAITALIVPTNVRREYWRFLDYARAPIIERL